MSGAANFEWLPQMSFGCALSLILEWYKISERHCSMRVATQLLSGYIESFSLLSFVEC